MERNVEYIKLLQERNRLKKIMAAKSKNELEQEEKERGFTTHFQGAHTTKQMDSTKPSKPTRTTKIPIMALRKPVQDDSIGSWHNHDDSVSAPAVKKRGWGEPTTLHIPQVKTSDLQKPHSKEYLFAQGQNEERGVRAQSGCNDDDDADYDMDFEELYDSQPTGSQSSEGGTTNSNEDFGPYTHPPNSKEVEHDDDRLTGTAVVSGEKNGCSDLISTPSGQESNIVSINIEKHEKGSLSSAPDSAQQVAESRSSTSAVMNSGEQPSASESLKDKLKYLGAAEKAQLLKLLQDEVGASKQPGPHHPPPQELQQQGQEQEQEEGEEAEEENVEKPQQKRHQSERPHYVPERATELLSSQDGSHLGTEAARAGHDRDPTSNTDALPRCPTPATPTQRPVMLRVRILSVWGQSKFVSLQALRLRTPATPNAALAGAAGQAYVDHLASLQPRVSSGLEPQPASSEVVRLLPILTQGGLVQPSSLCAGATTSASAVHPVTSSKAARGDVASRTSRSACWKGPVYKDKPLELTFKGTVEAAVHDGADAPPLQILLWSADMAESSEERESVNSAAAARDVDVYMGKQCIWSGELPEPGGAGLPGMGVYAGFGERGCSAVGAWTGSREPTPTLVLRFPPDVDPAVVGGVKQNSAAVHNISSKGQHQNKPTLGNPDPRPFAVEPHDATHIESAINSTADANLPNWLDGASINRVSRGDQYEPDRVSLLLGPNAANTPSTADAADANAEAAAGGGRSRVGSSRGRRQSPRGTRQIEPDASSSKIDDGAETGSVTQLRSGPRGEEGEQQELRPGSGSGLGRRARRNRAHLLKDLNPSFQELYSDRSLEPSVPRSTKPQASNEPRPDRDRAAELAAESYLSLGVHSSTFVPGAPGSGPSEGGAVSHKSHREAELRKSLEALRFADKFNMGRLSLATTALSAIGETEGPGSGASSVSRGESQKTDTMIAYDATDGFGRAGKIEEERRGPSNKQGESGEEGKGTSGVGNCQAPAQSTAAADLAKAPTLAKVASLEDLTTERNARIEKVQSKIQSTIAGLADILSTLPAHHSSSAQQGQAQSQTLRLSTRLIDSAATTVNWNRSKTMNSKLNSLHVSDRDQHVIGVGDCDAAGDDSDYDMFLPSPEKPSAETSAGPEKHVATSTGDSLPRGSVLRLEVLSTWGDVHYVGMNGLEIYDHAGRKLRLLAPPLSAVGARPQQESAISSISAFPSGLDAMPGYQEDPRRIANVLDGVNFTNDDLHIWLAPHQTVLQNLQSVPNRSELGHDGTLATITLKFNVPVAISMIRIFNFNKSRAHNQRGIRHCRIVLDGSSVFDGDIKKGSGLLQSEDEEAHLIAFTSNPKILTCVDKNEKFDAREESALEESLAALAQSMSATRPRTSSGLGKTSAPPAPPSPLKSRLQSSELQPQSQPPQLAFASEIERDSLSDSTFTRGSVCSNVELPNAYVDQRSGSMARGDMTLAHKGAIPALRETDGFDASNAYLARAQRRADAADTSSLLYSNREKDSAAVTSGFKTTMMVCADCSTIRVEIESTWGDVSYVGLCGLQVLAGPNCTPVETVASQLDARPRDLTSVGCFDDPRVLENLVNGVNNTANDEYMWLIPFTSGSEHFIEIRFTKVQPVVGLRFWNYNKSGEDVLRGAKQVSLHADGRQLCRCLLRPGPGCDGVAFGQTLLFSDIEELHEGRQPNCFSAVSSTGVAAGAAFVSGRQQVQFGAQSALRPRAYISPPLRQDYETQVSPQPPTGLLWRFTFFDNWNDGYYIGLDAIELFDLRGMAIDVLGQARALVTAVPYGLQDINDAASPGGSKSSMHGDYEDPRTPDKLFSKPFICGGEEPNADRKVESGEAERAQSCWLCPLARCMTPEERAACARRLKLETEAATEAKVGGGVAATKDRFNFPKNNTLLVQFNHPVTISAIRFYNYSKTVSRGVRDFSVELDGCLLHMGSLLRADREKEVPVVVRRGAAATGATGGAAGSAAGVQSDSAREGQRRSRGQSLVFSNDVKIIATHKDTVSYCGAQEQDVLCINDRQVMVRSRGMYDQQPPNTSLEGVFSDLNKRPTTSYSR